MIFIFYAIILQEKYIIKKYSTEDKGDFRLRYHKDWELGWNNTNN